MLALWQGILDFATNKADIIRANHNLVERYLEANSAAILKRMHMPCDDESRYAASGVS
jgi:hypothetical protein